MLKITILHEDKDILVIDKPSGVIVNRAETVQTETIQDWMAERLKLPITKHERPIINNESEVDYEQYFRERLGMVHRLDKETNGVMILAKNSVAFCELLREFREREVKKTYHALTHGIWKTTEGDIDLPIARRRDNRQRMGIREDGKESVTHYRVIAQYRQWIFPKTLKIDDRGYTGFSLVEFTPKTGRTHQIRVHATHLGHPLVGDEQYAGRKRSREDRKWTGRVMLSAQSLELFHPATHDKVRWESKDKSLEEILKLLVIESA